MLGLTFKWGALVGWAAVTGSLALAPLVLYAGCVLWTIGYDTIYAHQDKEDDLTLGLKSTALRFGEATPRWLSGFYAGAVVLWGGAGVLARRAARHSSSRLPWRRLQFAWQMATLDTADAGNCLARFKSNQLVGWVLFLGLVADMALHGAVRRILRQPDRAVAWPKGRKISMRRSPLDAARRRMVPVNS